MHRSTRRCDPCGRKFTDGVCGDAGRSSDSVGRIGTDVSAQIVDVARVALQNGLVETAETVNLVEQRSEEPDVGIGSDEDRVADATVRRLDPARVDEHDPRPSRRCASKLAEDVRNRIETGLAHPRVLTDDQTKIGVVEVRYRVDGARPEYRLTRHEFIRAILRTGRERAPDAKRSQQRRGVQ